ncbi:hypothetical protein GCM10009682_23530 [Luedemannella flava]|uniref:Uncharacterized protein n=1 Tax=Luedemannella flava TaxID=349316 RepID=A0ABN2LZ47_9ACTN
MPLSATEWAASAHIDADPVNSAAIILAVAILALAITATTTVLVLSPPDSVRFFTSADYPIPHRVHALAFLRNDGLVSREPRRVGRWSSGGFRPAAG